MSSQDYFSSFKLPSFFMKYLGWWQQKDSHWSVRASRIILHFLLVELFVIFQTAYLIDRIVNGTILEWSDTLSVLFTYYAMMIKCYWFMMQTETLKRLMKNMKVLLELSSFGRARKNRPSLEVKLRQLGRMSSQFFAAGYSMCILSAVLPLLRKEKGLTYDTWHLWNYKNNDTIFWLLAAGEFFQSIYATSIGCSLDIILFVSLGFVPVILDEISTEIRSIDGSNENSSDKLEKCVECHIKTKDYIKYVSRNFSIFFFIQSFMSSVIVCASVFLLTSYSLINDAPIIMKTFFYNAVMLAQIFLPCYYGSKISAASEELSLTLFHSRWLQSSKRYKTAIKMFLGNANKTIVMSAFGVVKINFVTFAGICNSAYSLYALVKKVNQKK